MAKTSGWEWTKLLNFLNRKHNWVIYKTRLNKITKDILKSPASMNGPKVHIVFVISILMHCIPLFLFNLLQKDLISPLPFLGHVLPRLFKPSRSHPQGRLLRAFRALQQSLMNLQPRLVASNANPRPISILFRQLLGN